MTTRQKSARLTVGELKKLAKKMEMVAPKYVEEDRTLSVTATVDGLIKPIKLMLERGYTVTDVAEFLKEQGTPLSPTVIRAGLARAGVSLRKKRGGKSAPEQDEDQDAQAEQDAQPEQGGSNDQGGYGQPATNQGYDGGDSYR